MSPEEQTTPSRHEVGRILIADDEETLLRAFVRTLSSAGYEVVTAHDGTSAAALAADASFDAIISDLGMPGLDGVELLRAVRSHDLDVPVILITGSPTVDSAIRAVELGALRYLVKPFEPRALLELVGDAVRLHKIAKLKRQALAIVGTGGGQLGDRASLEASFDSVLRTLWMAYQPIVSWSDRRVFAFEALLRADEPTLPQPGAILDAAERLGRLEELGRAIRRRVATVVERAPAAFVFVNLHTRDLLDEALYSPDALLSKQAHRVVFEITERASLDDVPDASSRVAALRKLGFRIAIDDLGAGYAGLASFAQLEPDVVKYDMSLIRDVHQSPTKQKVLESMTRLFAELDLLVISEGVETPEERDTLTALGCDLLQGYQFARPGPAFPPVAW